MEQFGPLTDHEIRSVEAVNPIVRRFDDDQDLIREGDLISNHPLLIEGFACTYKTLENGQRQIMAFQVPGDFCNLPSLPLARQDFSVGTLTPAHVMFIPRSAVLDWTRQHPRLALALWRAALIDASISREWIVNVGRRTAYQRTAHLLCELMVRMRAAGLAEGYTCDVPFTQVELADALGLTPVHVNRTLQWLRAEGLIEFGGGTLTINEWRRLQHAAGFDPTYLHQAGSEE